VKLMGHGATHSDKPGEGRWRERGEPWMDKEQQRKDKQGKKKKDRELLIESS